MAKNEVAMTQNIAELATGKLTENALTTFETAVQGCEGMALCEVASEAVKTIKLASAMNQLEVALTSEIMAQIMTLQGKRIGFKTDKDKDGGYLVKAVKEVMKEAIVWGARMTGNEVNIIANGCYLTKEYFTRKVRELPGLTDLNATVGVPRITGDKAIVSCRAKWAMGGVEQTLGYEDKDVCQFEVKVWDGKGGGGDQAVGKASKRLYQAIWQRATGSSLTLPSGDVDEIEATVIKDNSAAILKPGRHDTSKSKPKPEPTITIDAKKVDATPDEAVKENLVNYIKQACSFHKEDAVQIVSNNGIEIEKGVLEKTSVEVLQKIHDDMEEEFNK